MLKEYRNATSIDDAVHKLLNKDSAPISGKVIKTFDYNITDFKGTYRVLLQLKSHYGKYRDPSDKYVAETVSGTGPVVVYFIVLLHRSFLSL